MKYYNIVRNEDVKQHKNNKKIFFMTNVQTNYFYKLDSKKWTNKQRQVVYPRHQTPQGQSVANPGTPLEKIPIGNVSMT